MGLSSMFTQEKLKELLHYDPDTGIFTWLVALSNKGKMGALAGSLDKYGYLIIGIFNKVYRAHRLAWLYMIGEWPPNQIDHEDRSRSNNRWTNLRLATNTQNSHNSSLRSDNTTGHCGIYQYPKSKRWRAYITVDKSKQIHLGCFATKEEAVQAREIAALKYHGDFASKVNQNGQQ